MERGVMKNEKGEGKRFKSFFPYTTLGAGYKGKGVGGRAINQARQLFSLIARPYSKYQSAASQLPVGGYSSLRAQKKRPFSLRREEMAVPLSWRPGPFDRYRRRPRHLRSTHSSKCPLPYTPFPPTSPNRK
ncbi:hypothetical protein CDAR_290041 [Caerostris darwini]|uniref:Uncharacterized protein n=1 Tax=Caerostris darwini TaxID=1538125 RepID=A0AAV4WW29_9ARAC|nr:hypothetical protein CDAR_290041 [Caerostris darwini]